MSNRMNTLLHGSAAEVASLISGDDPGGINSLRAAVTNALYRVDALERGKECHGDGASTNALPADAQGDTITADDIRQLLDEIPPRIPPVRFSAIIPYPVTMQNPANGERTLYLPAWMRDKLIRGGTLDSSPTCTICGVNWVDVDNGEDTCPDCSVPGF